MVAEHFLLDIQFRTFMLVHVMLGLVLADLNRFMTIKWIHFRKINIGMLVSMGMLIFVMMGSKHLVLSPYGHLGLKWVACLLGMLSVFIGRYGIVQLSLGRSFFVLPKITRGNSKGEPLIGPGDVRLVNDINLGKYGNIGTSFLGNSNGIGVKMARVRLFINRTRSIKWGLYIILFILMVVVYPGIMHFAPSYLVQPTFMAQKWWWWACVFTLYVVTSVGAWVVFALTIFLYAATYKKAKVGEITKPLVAVSKKFESKISTGSGIKNLGLSGIYEKLFGDITDEDEAGMRKQAWSTVSKSGLFYGLIGLLYMTGVYCGPLVVYFIVDLIYTKDNYDGLVWFYGQSFIRQYLEIIVYGGISAILLTLFSVIAILRWYKNGKAYRDVDQKALY